MPSLTDLQAECKTVKDDVLTWRRHIHQHPEVSFKEFETAKYIVNVLNSFACPQLTIHQPFPNAVIGDLKGGAGDGPIIALRADIDALPLQEETDLPFKSANANVMHACGHDAHTAMLLGAAKVLCAQWRSLRGSVRFVFQHAEESPPGGARQLVEAGVMKGVKSIFGMHCAPWIHVGHVQMRTHVMTSSADSFTIRIGGRGGHASTPHLLVDPVPIAAEVVTALQTIVARKVDPQHAPVVSIPTMTTGPNETHNVIPDEVKLMGTIRTQNRAVREQVPVEIERIVKGITEAHSGTYKFELVLGYDMVDNDPAVTDQVRSMAKRVFGDDFVTEMQHPLYGGEDFSAYQRETPGCFVFLGTTSPHGATNANGLHTCKLMVDEDALSIGVCMHVGFVYENLAL